MAQISELENCLNEANKYLEQLGLEKPQAEVHFCSEHEWLRFKEKNVSSPAFYHPTEDRVYLGPDASIADLVHEYFGHALYSEQSTLGKKLKHNLKLISEIEEKYKIPKDADINIKHSKEFKIKKEKEDEYTIFCNTKESEIQDYTKLKKETKEFFDKIIPIQEGFSIWMEEKILKQLGLIELWNHRRQILADSPYLNFYTSFLKEESEKGTITLIYKLGFPKSKDKSLIKKVAEENLKNFNKLKYLIQYGSLERDIDLVAVYPDNLIGSGGLIYDGCIDINVLSETQFLQRLNLHDIEILESVLTGNLLVGDEKSFENLKLKVEKAKPSNEAIEHANKRSLETFNSALFFYHQNKFKCNESLLNNNDSEKVASTVLEEKILDFCTEELLYALNNLSFSLSYKLSAEHYSKKKPLTGFKTFKKNKVLNDLVNYMKDVENGRKELTENTTSDFINKTKNFLLDTFKP